MVLLIHLFSNPQRIIITIPNIPMSTYPHKVVRVSLSINPKSIRKGIAIIAMCSYNLLLA